MKVLKIKDIEYPITLKIGSSTYMIGRKKDLEVDLDYRSSGETFAYYALELIKSPPEPEEKDILIIEGMPLGMKIEKAEKDKYILGQRDSQLNDFNLNKPFAILKRGKDGGYYIIIPKKFENNIEDVSEILPTKIQV